MRPDRIFRLNSQRHYGLFFPLVAVMLALLLLSSPAQSQRAGEIIGEVERALESIRSVRGRFIQIAQDGAVMRGEYFLQRPGRIRFDYDNSPDVVVADGTYLTEVNTRTGNTRRRRLSATPLRVLLANDVDLRRDVTITQIENIAGSRRVTLHRTNNRNEGELTLIFTIESQQLEAWQTLESNGERTTVRLETMQEVTRFGPGTFEVRR